MGTNDGVGNQKYTGFQLGVALPLWYGNQKSKIDAAKTGSSILENERTNYKIQLAAKYQSFQSDIRYLEIGISYYETQGKELVTQTLFHANKAFQNGELNFLQYIQLIENAKAIQSNYLSTLHQYNMTVLEANYLIN